MSTVCRPETVEHVSEAAGTPSPATLDAGTVIQTVDTGEILFQAGDERTLYRVERGAICHYMLWADGRHDVIEFAFPGDIVGLGHLREHVSTAQAMVDTVVSLVSEPAFSAALERDSRLAFRLSAAVEREFDHLRDRAISANHVPAAAKVANFLLALSQMSVPEGRDPELIPDEITAGFVADKLDMSIDKLGAALVALKQHGAVRETSGGLRIVDPLTLRRMADAA
ncbi:MAG: Crp/Fnr family transcriptional regulator [Hyphomicrobium sp.]|uniref:Crp/Fnr family transcriptional regulator n=1 Tax=Hyphomicrobium sp. TaxID=82 RepID=UPI003D0DA967